VTHTISGVDIALWDILGQATSQPIGRLLGGRYRDRVRPYASVLMDEPTALAQRLAMIKADGFRAFKIGWGPFGRRGHAFDEEIICAAREAVGPESALMVDAGGSNAYWPHGYKWALRTAEMLADYEVAWFEEPLSPDSFHDYVQLRAHSKVPIAGGEVLTRRQAFQPWLEARAFDIVQPDVTKVGGISEERRIAWMAHECGVRFVPHGWNTAVGLAADLHLASAFPNTDLVEYLNGSPFIDEIVESPWRLDREGMLAIPDQPGLGIKFDRKALAKFTGQPRLFD
jgi:L-alanine-DL-glutamate epimerase-like enolase superfamily enzyme